LLNLNNESTCILDLWFPQRLQWRALPSDIYLCNAVEIHRRFGMTFWLYHQGQIVILEDGRYWVIDALFVPANRVWVYLQNPS
jgi:hypothetical protein